MEEAFLVKLCVLALFAVVQSLFGVGLLVFGTPTLLLLGQPFEVALVTLLPASLAISVLQLAQGHAAVRELRIALPLVTVPCIVLGLSLVLIYGAGIDLKLVVGVMLLCGALVRRSPWMLARLRQFLVRHLRAYLAVTGMCHGVSNMGGAPLAVLSSTLYSEKAAIRANIAYGYVIFASAQILVLWASKPQLFSSDLLLFAALGAVVYALLGVRVYRLTSSRTYGNLFTALELSYGLVLLGQVALQSFAAATATPI